jgi:hypothetical protein
MVTSMPTSLTGKIVGATALLAAVAAFVNSGIDVVKSIRNIPTNVYDRTNEEMFKKHFNKKPLLSQPVQITSASVTVEMLLQVYESGDLFVRYGEFQQWLPFKTPKVATFSLFPQAYAQSAPPSKPKFEYDKDFSMWQFGKSLPPIVIDIDDLKKVLPLPPSKQSELEKMFVVSELQPYRASFSKTTQAYERIFKADPGYKFTKFDLQLGSANNSTVKRVETIDGGSAIRVEYSITSGPIFDQYSGWIHATINTQQEKTK